MSTATTPTLPRLAEITGDEPIVATELGKGFGGVMWIVEPESFPALVDHINRYGGPNAWSLRPATEMEVALHRQNS